jgi:hypothetical protein
MHKLTFQENLNSYKIYLFYEKEPGFSGDNNIDAGSSCFCTNVNLALEIREKEVNSAIENIQNGNEEDSTKNLLQARNKLQIVQEKVSLDVADEVKESVNEVKNKINESDGLSKDFELYSLEEEKTKLKAELVIVVEGKENQTKIWEVKGQLGEVNNDIKGWVVEHSTEGNESSEGLTWEVKTDIASGDYGGDDGLTPEIKTYVAGSNSESSVAGDGDGGYAPGTTAGGGGGSADGGTTNEIVEGDGGEGDYAEGTTADGTDAGGDGSIGSSEGTESSSGGGDSGETESADASGDSGITGEATKNADKKANSINLKNIIKSLFGI